MFNPSYLLRVSGGGGGGGGGGGATFFVRRTMISFSSVKNYVSLQPFLRKILTPLISFSSIGPIFPQKIYDWPV